jgi:hypothetical protein
MREANIDMIVVAIIVLATPSKDVDSYPLPTRAKDI